MINTISRMIFFVLSVLMLLFFAFYYQSIKIETSLSELSPKFHSNEDFQYINEVFLEDFSKRFTVVVSGDDTQTVNLASDLLNTNLSAIAELTVQSQETLETSFKETLFDYRFTLLSKEQQQQLEQSSIEKLATQAQRRLYQLGDGIRITSFEQDPLGVYADFVLSKFDESMFVSKEATVESKEGKVPFYKSFNVVFSEYPKSMPQQQAIYQKIKDTENLVTEKYKVEVLYSGMFFFAVDSAQAAKGDIQLIAIGSIVGVIILMLLVFRSLFPLLLSLSSIAVGIGFGLVISTITFGSIHIFTIVFGASLIGIVVDYSLHYFYHHLSEVTTDHEQNRMQNDQTLIRAMLLSVITSLIGYGALGLSDIAILKKVAVFSCSGLLMAWLAVIVLGPLLHKRKIVARQTVLVTCINALRKVFTGYPKTLAIISLSVTIIAGAYFAFAGIKVNDDPRLFFHVSAKLLKNEQKVASITQVFEPGRFIVVEGKSEEDVFTSLETLYERLQEKAEMVTSVRDWLPSVNSQAQNYSLLNKLYKDKGVLDLFYKNLGIAAEQADNIKLEYIKSQQDYLTYPKLKSAIPTLPPLWIEYNDKVFSFVLIKKNSDLSFIESVSNEIENLTFLNTLGNAVENIKDQRESGKKLLIVAYALIALMLIIYYKKLSSCLLLLIPFSASIIAIALISLLGQSITIFHVMALFLVLGLGMDYIIFAKEMTDHPHITRQAILLSAITSLLSFGLLAFSSMPVVQAFGSTILIANSINFIATISLFDTNNR